VVAADLNGDGFADLAVTQSQNGVALFAGTGTGSFVSQLSFSVGSGPQGMLAADFNADGKLDLAVVDESSGSISVLLNK
jgi:hypothetical protein